MGKRGKSNRLSVFIIVMFAMIMVICSVHPVFAGDIWGTAENSLVDLYGNLRKFSVVLLTVVMVLAALLFGMTGNPNKAETRKSWGYKAAVAIVIILGVGWIVQWLISLTSGAPGIDNLL